MSLIGDIVNKIFHPSSANAVQPPAAPQSTSAPSPEKVDVAGVLTQMAKGHSERLNWQSSIVDLLKLLGLDSSLGARKQLAKELQFQGDMNDSAAMNVWLLHQVMEKLAENGGKIPDELKH